MQVKRQQDLCMSNKKGTQVTRRQLVFFVFFLLAAAPLVWLNIDPHAGDRLLRWTSSTPQRTALVINHQPVTTIIKKSGN
jgi:hypothetical protein